ncbi:MAG: hypothetical protein PHS44_05745 [Candidatus Dojkabacteria bacterium]|nr:hypothetical protein [Candidatus Dojkabacteria bacterium]
MERHEVTVEQSRENVGPVLNHAVESAYRGIKQKTVLRRIADEIVSRVGSPDLNPTSNMVMNPQVMTAVRLCVNGLYPSTGVKATGLDLRMYFPDGVDAARTPLRYVSTDSVAESTATLAEQSSQSMRRNLSSGGAEILVRILVGDEAFGRIVQENGPLYLAAEDLPPGKVGKAWGEPAASAPKGKGPDRIGAGWGGSGNQLMPRNPVSEGPGTIGAGWSN